ncbi:MAG: acyltransferase [Muribaculaceae bacterium]|nr:acyltransferase [Muribaculaceae bacterium]
MAQPQRIAYIDFMKCLCIMLIVMYHIDHEFFNYLAPNLNNALQAFRLPMYYFISGIFFKLYGGFADFTRRKVNNILVPFVFFVVLAFGLRLVEFGARYLIGAQPIDINPSILIEPFYMRSWLLTSPLWFLLSLFWVNIIFYALQRLIKPLWGLLLATVAISAVGYWLGTHKVELPLMLDTSMVALPYFVLGWGMKRLGVLEPSRYDKWGVLVLAAVALPIYYLSDYMNLHLQVLPAYWKLYVLPFVAILSLFWACKPLPRIPVLCHYGRYSLIILGTHMVLFLPIRSWFILRGGMEPGIGLTLIVFALTMLVLWPVIWLLKTYAPRFTAQEPFFKPGWKLI